MIQAVVNKDDFNRIMSALSKVEAVVLGLKESVPEEGAREFASQLASNITTQKFGDFGHPHKGWKKGMPNESRYWLLLGTALKSILPKKIKSDKLSTKWFVGFIYSGGAAGGVRRTVRPVVAGKALIGKRTPWAERMQKEYSHGAVRRVDPKDYIPQKRSTGTVLGGPK